VCSSDLVKPVGDWAAGDPGLSPEDRVPIDEIRRDEVNYLRKEIEILRKVIGRDPSLGRAALETGFQECIEATQSIPEAFQPLNISCGHCQNTYSNREDMLRHIADLDDQRIKALISLFATALNQLDLLAASPEKR
jgi:hypothetical protein